MILSPSDIKRIESLGYKREYFVIYKDDFYRLKNINNHCVFLDVKSGKCMIYKHRPLGCRIYPVIYVEGIGITLDSECPAIDTITHREFIAKGKLLMKLLKELKVEIKY